MLKASDVRKQLANHLKGTDWTPVGRLGALPLNRALHKEMAPTHLLRGQSVTAVARQIGSDSVLYLTGNGRLAEVHLTWSRQSVAHWPSTTFYDTVEDFLAAAQSEAQYIAAMELSLSLGAAHPEGTILCTLCGSDWGQGDFGDTCPLCGGGALARPCPKCGGTCGALWTRAIIDSVDQGEAVWIGACKANDAVTPHQ